MTLVGRGRKDYIPLFAAAGYKRRKIGGGEGERVKTKITILRFFPKAPIDVDVVMR
jgi:hypothetical protein